MSESSPRIRSGYNHSLDTGIAITLGLHAAIVFNHIVYWLNINADKPGCELIEGNYWMYETQKQMAEFFGYLTEDDVCRGIKKLLDHGLLVKGNFNKNKFDRTSWYAVTDKTLIQKKFTKPQICGMDSAPVRNPIGTRAVCINTIEEQEDKQEQQQAASPAAAVSSEKKKEQPQAYQVKPKPMQITKPMIYECLKEQPILEACKAEITHRYDEDTIKNAIAWATHPETKLSKGLSPAIKWACQNKPEVPKKRISPYEELSQHFKHGEFYEMAECSLTPGCIGFHRGMNQAEVNLVEFFGWEKIDALCKKFGIPFKRKRGEG